MAVDEAKPVNLPGRFMADPGFTRAAQAPSSLVCQARP